MELFAINNFSWGNAATFAFALSSSGATGTLEVAFPMLVPMSQVDGSWWLMLPGTTPFVVDDVFTAADALDGTDSKVQQLVARLFNRYLPHTADATQVTASGGRTLTFATATDEITASSGSFVQMNRLVASTEGSAASRSSTIDLPTPAGPHRTASPAVDSRPQPSLARATVCGSVSGAAWGCIRRLPAVPRMSRRTR
jgi:hypothetical protein